MDRNCQGDAELGHPYVRQGGGGRSEPRSEPAPWPSLIHRKDFLPLATPPPYLTDPAAFQAHLVLENTFLLQARAAVEKTNRSHQLLGRIHGVRLSRPWRLFPSP